MDDFESLSLTELIRLQDRLSSLVNRRFGRPMALVFTDVVGSTGYFARYGNEAGRSLQQRHLDALGEALRAHGGRLVDTAGDGAFSCFPQVEPAVRALLALAPRVSADNADREREHQLVLRGGVHWGRVLADETVVTGDAVNVAARVAGSAQPGELRVTEEAFRELPSALRQYCHALGPVTLRGLPEPFALLSLVGHDPTLFPSVVRVEETGEEFPLPALDIIAFGRTGPTDAGPGNDIVLTLPDETALRQVSRFHFELRRRAQGYVLRPVSAGLTEVDGQVVAKGAEAPVLPGTVARLSRVVTLRFGSLPVNSDLFATIMGL